MTRVFPALDAMARVGRLQLSGHHKANPSAETRAFIDSRHWSNQERDRPCAPTRSQSRARRASDRWRLHRVRLPPGYISLEPEFAPSPPRYGLMFDRSGCPNGAKRSSNVRPMEVSGLKAAGAPLPGSPCTHRRTAWPEHAPRARFESGRCRARRRPDQGVPKPKPGTPPTRRERTIDPRT